METKALHRFAQRVEAYEGDLELAKVVIDKLIEENGQGKRLSELFRIDATKYPHIHKHSNTKNARMVMGYHLRTTLHVAFVKELYEDFSEYLNSILGYAAHVGIKPERLIGGVPELMTLTTVEVLQTSSWDALISYFSSKVFRHLENKRSTIELVQGMSDRIGLKLEKSIFAAAIPYLESRHILVHRDGRPDKRFKSEFPDVKLNKNGQILVDYNFIKDAREKIYALAAHIDSKIVESEMHREQDLRGRKAHPGEALSPSSTASTTRRRRKRVSKLIESAMAAKEPTPSPALSSSPAPD
jgi:hypothetical protein